MQYPFNAFGLLSKKQYAPKAEIRFMIKLLTDLWRECTICAVFFSMSLMVSIMYLLPQFLVIRNYAKITNGLFARIIGKISALTILQYVNFINDKPIGRIKYALN